MRIAMSKPRKFYVFTSGEHQYLRFALVFFLLFGLYLIYRLGFVWLYFVFFVILAVDFFVFPYLNASISFTPQGVCYQKAWKKPVVMKWEDIFCCGLFSANILGAPKAEGYFYFSAKPVSYSQLTGQNTLPRQSQDFLFLSSQPDVYETVIQYWNSSKASQLKQSAEKETPFQPNSGKPVLAAALGVLAVLCLLMLILSRDLRWLAACVCSLAALLFLRPAMKR